MSNISWRCGKHFVEEVKHFHQYVRHSQTYGSAEHGSLTHQDLYKVRFNDRVQSAFSNVEVLLRLFLNIIIANCSGERSFSQLKKIKNEYRTTMTQGKLCSLSIVCIGSDKLRSLSLNDKILMMSSVTLLWRRQERKYFSLI